MQITASNLEISTKHRKPKVQKVCRNQFSKTIGTGRENGRTTTGSGYTGINW